VGVAQLRRDVEPEAIAVLHNSITQLDAQGALLLERLLCKQGLQRSIQHLTNIFQ
jgi:hypothetical protein